MKIAIDGPAGAGKSTLAKALGRKLNFVYIDTGAMYRALTWKALQGKIDLSDSQALLELAAATDFHFEAYGDEQRLICDHQDLTDLIRSPEVNSTVSIVASHPTVREIMVKKQRLMAQTRSVIMDGRDIGEQVLPDADYKFYVTAGLQERAQRRALEMANQGYHMPIEDIKKEIETRDYIDSTREVGALKILPDSIIIDTTQRSTVDVLNQMVSIVGGR